MAGIFISYRREDSSGYAGRLFDILSARFGRENVFMDLDTIQGGDDFATVIKQSIGGCAVLLAVIGEGWLSVAGVDGKRRLEILDDFVRLEIATAFERGVRVIPVLVGKAEMPQSSMLPEDLRGLTLRHAVEVRDAHFRRDAEDLMRSIADKVPQAGSRFNWSRSKGSLFAVLGILVVCVVFGWMALWRSKTPARISPQAVIQSPAGPSAAPMSTSQAATPPQAAPASADAIDRGGKRSSEPTKTTASVKVANIVGKWKGIVTYDWPNTVYMEHFDFEVDGTEVSGTASLLDEKHSIMTGTINGNKLIFNTKSASTLDDKIYQDRHAYKGVVEGDTIKLTLTTDTDYDSHVPVHFTVTREGK